MEVLDPTGLSTATQGELAPRLQSLSGARLGVLSNGKPNAAPLLGVIERGLHERYTLRDTLRVDKLEEGMFAHEAPDWMIKHLAAFDAVLHGCGD